MENEPFTSAALDLRAEIHYDIDPKPLGIGGFSVVHRAWEPGLDRWVALKVVTISKVVRDMGITEREAELRHRNEIRAAGRLHHDHIVKIYNYGRGEDTLWYAMTLLPGGSIRSRIRPAGGKPADVSDPDHIIDWLEILIRICRTVGFCHGQGVVHRDLKHDNVLFDENDRPTLTDFGLARIEEQEQAEGIFAGGDQVYSAPELLKGEPQDERTDVYSLGCIAHFALTGQEPFPYKPRWDMLMRDERAALKREIHPGLGPGELEGFTLPQEANPALREDLSRIILRAMSGDPDKRHSQPRHLADAFQEQLDIERTLRRVPQGEFVAERAAPMLISLLRTPDLSLDEAALLGTDDPAVDSEVRRTLLNELIRRGVVVEQHQAFALARRLDLREGRRRREKQALGEYLMRVVTSLDPPVSLSVDGGSTTNQVINALLRQPAEVRDRVTALRTNNTCWVWDSLNKALPQGWRLIGGWVRPTSLATLGSGVTEQFRAFSPAAAVVGTMGLVADATEGGAMTLSVDTEEEAELKRTVLSSALLLSAIVFDSTKFGISAGHTIIRLEELLAMANEHRGQRRILLVTTHPSVHAHTGPDARERTETDRRRFVEHLRDLLQRIVKTHGNRRVRLTLTPISLAAPSAHSPVSLPAKGESVDNLPFVLTKHLAEITSLPGDHEVVVSMEL
jgi:serine/threonine protein kinase/DeoR/GlpR family transcriptional regulator of sugar metabolism